MKKFGKRWFRGKSCLLNPLSYEEAKAAHESRNPYVVVSYDGDQPKWFAEIGSKHVGLGVYDFLAREFLTYLFQEVEPQRLFLSMATDRKYDGVTTNILEAHTSYFERDGKVVVERVRPALRTKETLETSTDVSLNWEDWPEFDNYDSLTRVERSRIQ